MEIITTERTLVPTDRQLAEHPVIVYLAGLGESSRDTMTRALSRAAELLTGDPDPLQCDWAIVRYAHMQALRAKLAEGLSPSSCNLTLSAVRGVLKAAWLAGLMTSEDYHRACEVESVKGERLPAGRHVTNGEILALLQACADYPGSAGARDAALIGLAYSCGLRRAELVPLDLADYDPETGELRVRGKGGKERLLFVTNGAADALADWLEIRGNEPGPLFYCTAKGGKVEPRRMTKQAIYNRVRRRAKQAKIRELSPHDLRRSFCGELLDTGADLAIVQRLMGHASPTTTARYDRRPEHAKRKALESLHLPLSRRRDLFTQ